MSLRRILVMVIVITAVFGGVLLWSRHGAQVFLAGLGAMMC